MRESLMRMVRRLASVGWAVKTGITRRRETRACISAAETPSWRSRLTAAAIVSPMGSPRSSDSRARRRRIRTRSSSSARLTSWK